MIRDVADYRVYNCSSATITQLLMKAFDQTFRVLTMSYVMCSRSKSWQHPFVNDLQHSNRSIAFPHAPLRHGVAVGRRSEICLSAERSKDARR